MPFVWRRGGVYQFRRRLPKKLTELGAPTLLCLSLRTEVLPDARAASAGDILITRLMVRGGAGVVTDGGLRDSMRIGELDIPAYHSRPSSPTNLTHHEAIELNVPIGCGDAPVFPGDIIVGDGDSVIVIPAGIADEVADEAVEMTAYEDFVLERVTAGETIIGLYPCTRDEHQVAFAKWREANRR